MQARIAFAQALLEFHCRQIKDALGDHEAELRARLEHLAARVADEGDPEFFDTFGLSIGARRVLTLMAAAALDLDSQRLASLLSGTATLTLPILRHIAYSDLPLAASLVDLDANGALRRFVLIERCDGGPGELHESKQNWAISPRVLRWWAGDYGLDADIQAFARIIDTPADAGALCFSDAKLDEARRALEVADALVVASGEKGNGRRTLLCTVAHAANMRLLVVDTSRLANETSAFRRQVRLVVRECLLLGLRPLLCNIDVLDQSRLDIVGQELSDDLPGTLLATCGTSAPALRWGRPNIIVELKPPISQLRAKLWLRELGQGTQDDAEYLATQYPLAPALIHHVAKAAKARASDRRVQPDDIYGGIRAVLDDKLGDYACRVEVKQTWDDVVLPEDQFEQISDLIARIRQRRTVYEQWGFAAKVGKGLGTTALFSGPPGTGKTMICALIAKELGLELYQVDMAKITSKYIGETERHLAALFDAAEAGHAVLLFDEADSLFGKRTEVKSSNDRYANLETNYLLQRLERFTGICLLTSNHESNIDPAFQRRLSLHIRFEVPDVEERAALWEAMLPAAAPVAAGIDFMTLAKRFAMSGGYIRNATLRAAFRAADEGVAISTQHLVCAAKAEYEGIGKIAL